MTIAKALEKMLIQIRSYNPSSRFCTLMGRFVPWPDGSWPELE